MRFPQPSRRDPYELRLLHLLDRRRTAVPHRLSETAGELVQQRSKAPLVGHATFDALRDELLDVLHVTLEVPILRERARLHRPERAHAAVLLVPLALVDDDLARRLVG